VISVVSSSYLAFKKPCGEILISRLLPANVPEPLVSKVHESVDEFSDQAGDKTFLFSYSTGEHSHPSAPPFKEFFGLLF